jgi:6-hydroxycyclohex-1-ene-1-carbonyl-CoA dehydrogenase
MADINMHGWMMTGVGEPVVDREIPVPELAEGEALVEVAGCGVCHTDISFLQLGVPTRMKPPLVLGHEISGTVVQTGPNVDQALLNKPVLVPAVLPCGTCPLCESGHRRICRNQIMPGNDRHGGFASHVVVPTRYLCPVKDEVLAEHDLWELSVVSDAVTTPFQAVKRANLLEGEIAVVIGAGGIGIHLVQIAAAVGARVIALDIDAGKLAQAQASGAAATVDVTDLGGKEIKGAVKAAVKDLSGPKACWKIFETSGTKPGQSTAFSLLGFGGVLAIVGFTMSKLEVRLSNLMAFDAEMFGIWGCDPVLYPEVLDWIAEGRIKVRPYVEKHPLAEINDVLTAAHHGKLEKRAVMVP